MRCGLYKTIEVAELKCVAKRLNSHPVVLLTECSNALDIL